MLTPELGDEGCRSSGRREFLNEDPYFQLQPSHVEPNLAPALLPIATTMNWKNSICTAGLALVLASGPGKTAWTHPLGKPSELKPARLQDARPVVEADVPDAEQQAAPPARESRRGPADAAGESVIDGVKISDPPLTTISRATILKAATRDKSSPDFATDYFRDLPCVALGPARSPTGASSVLGPVAGDFCYRPLYFEEKNLERYGRSWRAAQPIVSGARFFATIPALPYLMTVHNPRTCYDWQFPYPAGFSAPRVRELPPFSLEGAGIEAGAALGLIFLIP